jgi:DNA-binding protein HU-beta
MNKSELVDAVAEQCEITKLSAKLAVEAVVSQIIHSVKAGDTVQLIGFGAFSSGKREARVGRNPSTGEAMKIAAKKTVKFSAGKAFKEAVNSVKKKK